MTNDNGSLLIGLGIVVAFILSWILYGIISITIFALFIFVPYFIFETIMYYTINNVINFCAKIPTILGWAIGFIISFVLSIPTMIVAIWIMANGYLIALLNVIKPADHANFIESYVAPWEANLCIAGLDFNLGQMFLARLYYHSCEWLWKSNSIFISPFPFIYNGVEIDSSFVWVCKLFLVALPTAIMFILPLVIIVWACIGKPIAGSMSMLVSSSENGRGRI